MGTESLLTPAQTASLIGVTPHTLAVWRCSKRYPLAFIKVGRKVMYHPAAINQFLKRQTVEVADGRRP